MNTSRLLVLGYGRGAKKCFVVLGRWWFVEESHRWPQKGCRQWSGLRSKAEVTLVVELGILSRWVPALHSSALVSTVVTGLEFYISWFPGVSRDKNILEATFQSPKKRKFRVRMAPQLNLWRKENLEPFLRSWLADRRPPGRRDVGALRRVATNFTLGLHISCAELMRVALLVG